MGLLMKPLYATLLSILASSCLLSANRLDNYTDWGITKGDQKSNQYSELAYIHAANVHQLEPAWEYQVDDATDRSNMHSNPIIIDGRWIQEGDTNKIVVNTDFLRNDGIDLCIWHSADGSAIRFDRFHSDHEPQYRKQRAPITIVPM